MNKKILLFLLVGIFLMSMVSVSAILETKSFDPTTPTYGEITISDWLGISKKVNYRLMDYGMSVINVWGEGEYKLYKKTHLFTGAFYKDVIGNKGDLRDLEFFIWEDKQETRYNPIYENQNCILDYSNSTNGTEICDSVLISNESYEIDLSGWISYEKGMDLEESEGKFKYTAKRKANKPIDIILEAHDKEFEEWIWYNNSWDYKRQLNVTETSGSSLTNYSTLIYVNYTEDTNSNANANFSDLRFLNSAETEELDYWIENKTDSSFAWVWVKVPSLTASSTETIYMYYGNVGASSNSNGENTFLFFDDFSNDLSKWTALNPSGCSNSITTGMLQMACTGSGSAYMETNTNFNLGYAVRFKVRNIANTYAWRSITNSNSDGSGVGWETYTSTSEMTAWLPVDYASLGGIGTATKSGTSLLDFSSNVWYNKELRQVNSSYTEARVWNDTIDFTRYNTDSITMSNNKPVALGTWKDSRTIQYDDILIRNFVSSEPTYIFGTEEFGNILTITLNSPINYYNSTSSSIEFNCSGTDETGLYSLNLTINGSVYETVTGAGNTNLSLVSNETLTDGFWEWYCTGNDDTETKNSSTRFFTIDTTPFIEFLTPPTLPNYANITQDFIPIKINTTTTQFENISFDLFNVNGTTFNQFYTNQTYDINFTNIPDAHYHYNVTICATTGKCNSTETRHINHDATAPNITITSPSEVFDFLVENFSLDLNWTVTDINLDSCWFNYNGINTTLTCNDNHTEFNYSENINNLTFYANDTFGNINSEETTWDYVLLETNRTFDNPVYETQTSSFIIDYLVPNNTININALLNYNGTQFTSTTICDGINCTSTTTIDIPTIESSTEDINFSWEITIFSSSPSVTINFSSETQTINEIQFEECGVLTDVTLNFTSFDEEDLTGITSFDFDGNFEFWLGAGTHKKQYNLTKSGVSSVAICLEPTGVEFRIDADIEYDETDTDNYTRRNYYFLNDTVSDDTQNIGLGLLKVGDSTSFIEKVQDRNLLSVPGVLVITERYYPGLDEFRIVQIGETDNVGETVGFFQTETVEYRFKVKNEIEVVLTTDKQKVVGTVAPFTIALTIGESIDVSWREFEELPDFSSSPITADRDTKIITWTYLDDGDDFEQANLRVWLINDTNDEIEICNDVGNESSQTLTCNLSSYDSGRFNIGAFLTRDGTTYIIEQTIFSLGGMDIDENYGLFLGLLILLICAFAFKYNEIAGIILLNVGAIAVDLIGFIDFGWTTLFAFISASIIIVAVLER